MVDDGETARQVRLGVVGTGLATRRLHWPALRQMLDRYRIVAFANDTRRPAEEFAALTGLSMDGYHADYHELLRREDVEAVLVALPIPLLYPVTRSCLEAGKHVVCEKPPGTNLEQAREFLALAGRFPDRKVLVAENFFYRDDLRLARSLLDAGAIGRVHLMAWRLVTQLVPREGEYSSTPWRQAPFYRGGPHLDAGVHHIAQIRLLCGDVQDLQAYLQYANPTMGGPSDLALNLHFVSHAIGSYLAAHLPIPTPGETNEMRLYGEGGILIVGRGQVRLLHPDGAAEEHAVESDPGQYNLLLNFHDAIVHDEPIVGTIGQSFHNLLLAMRALDSAEEHRLVEITEAPGGLSESGVPLWRPRGAVGLFDGLPCKVTRDGGP
jgi:predicted dehydrogenase